jgi:two-component system sensor histidine kinase ChiS
MGFFSSALLFAALGTLYRIFPRKNIRTPRHFAWFGVALGGVFLVLGLGLVLLPPPGAITAGSVLQLLGLIGFETAAFWAAYLPDHNDLIKRTPLVSTLGGAFLFVLVPGLGIVPLQAAAAVYTSILLLLSLCCILLSRRQKKDGSGYIAAAAAALFIDLAFCIPLPILQVFFLTGALFFFLTRRKRLFPLAPVETVLPEKNPAAQGMTPSISPFIPKEFLSILHKSTAMELHLGDHIKQDMTIFFSDIRQFTDLSEHLTPEESFKFINSYLARIVPVITEHGGFVDKYIGDAILALFPQEKGADMAVRTAIAIQEKILEYNTHRAKCGYRSLSMGIGLHTGTLMVGVVGVEDRMQNTVISDAVNLASRLESITKVFNVSMAISEETFKNLEDPGSYMYRFIGKVRVKGKLEPVSVFEIFDGINPEILERKMRANTYFEQGMLNYYQKNFSEALYNFRKVLEILPEDGASIFYLDNCMAKLRI